MEESKDKAEKIEPPVIERNIHKIINYPVHKSLYNEIILVNLSGKPLQKPVSSQLSTTDSKADAK